MEHFYYIVCNHFKRGEYFENEIGIEMEYALLPQTFV